MNGDGKHNPMNPFQCRAWSTVQQQTKPKPMKTKHKQIKNKSQQGDVILRRITAMPDGDQKLISKGRCVVAHGESGHSHVVEDDEAELIQIGERMLLKLGRKATLTHEEHAEQALSPGIWEIGRVQEWDYISRMARDVRD